MVGVNTEGKVKVWLHADLSMDRPLKGFTDERRVERDMVMGVLRLLAASESPKNGNFSGISEELMQAHPLTFERVLRDLGSYTLRKYYSTIPDRLVTLQGLMKQGQFQPSRRLSLPSPVVEPKVIEQSPRVNREPKIKIT